MNSLLQMKFPHLAQECFLLITLQALKHLLVQTLWTKTVECYICVVWLYGISTRSWVSCLALCDGQFKIRFQQIFMDIMWKYASLYSSSSTFLYIFKEWILYCSYSLNPPRLRGMMLLHCREAFFLRAGTNWTLALDICGNIPMVF